MLEELFELLYKKLEEENENDKKSKNGYFEYFVHVILKNETYKNSGVIISDKAVKNYYEKYVEKKENKSGEPKNNLKNVIAKYLGFKNYDHFLLTHNTKNSIKSSAPSINSFYTKKTITQKKSPRIVIGIIVSLIVLLFFYSYTNSKTGNCIIWENTVFKQISCSSKIAIDNTIYNIDINNFKKIEANKHTVFFNKRKPLVWYGKSLSGKMEFFNNRGVHPFTLKELKPITEYIINKYILKKTKDKTITNLETAKN